MVNTKTVADILRKSMRLNGDESRRQRLLLEHKLPRFWLCRLYLALNVLFLAMTAGYEPRALLYGAVRGGGSDGVWWVAMVGLLAIVSLFDSVINDLLPAKFQFVWAKNRRHVIYMAMALGLMCMAYVVAVSSGASVVHLFIVVSVVVSVAVAFFDLFNRHAE